MRTAVEFLKRALLAAAIAFLAYLAIAPFTSQSSHGALFGVMQALPIGIAIGFIIAFLIAPYFYERFAKGLFFPSGNVRPLPPELCHIRAKIVDGKHNEAYSELEQMLRKDRYNIHLVTLMADLLLDGMQDYAGAAEFLMAYFGSRSARTSEDLPLLMRLVDALSELDRNADAADFLRRELKRRYPRRDLDAIRKRLDST